MLNASAEGSYLPGTAGVRLLADRRQGVGADRILVFTSTKAEPSLLVYTPEGEAAKAEPAVRAGFGSQIFPVFPLRFRESWHIMEVRFHSKRIWRGPFCPSGQRAKNRHKEG